MGEPARADLLIELGCEELPPKSLDRLASAFFQGVCDSLETSSIDFDRQASRSLYSPRRLAVLVSGVADRQADRTIERRGPALSAAFDGSGEPTRAALGFAASVGRDVAELETLKNDKGEWLYCRVEEPGKNLRELIYPILDQALAGLPVARPMRWSNHDYSFVRPVHWLVVLHGSEVLEGHMFGRAAARATRGHRIHAPGPHEIPDAGSYPSVLEKAYVLVDPAVRRERIESLAVSAGNAAGGVTRMTPSLLDEVNNLVEWPGAVVCAFDEDFLDVPQEALIASMEDHQKFFPLLDPSSQRLLPRFVAITNIASLDPPAVVDGYERVIRPRLSDARFFWEQDRKAGLESWQPMLDNIVFQEKLGSVGDKSRRIANISEKLAGFLGVDADLARRAALLAKCDLVSQMVGEFPELQGVMGAHYATAAGEKTEICQAIGEHYAPRFSGDDLPASPAGQLISLADRLDSLVGIFSIGLQPTGNKDPFALRRAALGVVRLLMEKEISIPVDELLKTAADALSGQAEVGDESVEAVRAFILDRARHHLRELGFETRLINAVLEAPLGTLVDLHSRLLALQAFMQLPEAEPLVAANKRIGNILRKSNQAINLDIDEDIFDFEEEGILFGEVKRLENQLGPLYEQSAYQPALEALSSLKETVDRFFDEVMVMDDNPAVRANRLALLGRLKSLFDRVADLSRAS
jgi:glycyl-tRNA synthetase beta chain